MGCGRIFKTMMGMKLTLNLCLGHAGRRCGSVERAELGCYVVCTPRKPRWV